MIGYREAVYALMMAMEHKITIEKLSYDARKDSLAVRGFTEMAIITTKHSRILYESSEVEKQLHLRHGMTYEDINRKAVQIIDTGMLERGDA